MKNNDLIVRYTPFFKTVLKTLMRISSSAVIVLVMVQSVKRVWSLPVTILLFLIVNCRQRSSLK